MREDGSKPKLWPELKEGLRFVLGNPNLRAQAGCTATSNFFSSLGFAIILVFAVRELHLSAGLIGIVFSIGSIGSMVAAFTATRISQRFGIGPTTIAVGAGLGAGASSSSGSPRQGTLRSRSSSSASSSSGSRSSSTTSSQVSYRQAICPPRLQGRMNSVMRFIVWGTIPLGALSGGILGSTVGLRETILIGAIGTGLSVLWIIFSPQRHLREMPEPVDDDGVPQPKSEPEPRTDELGAALPQVADPLSPVDVD